ncbi:hypothetical protein O181_014001 [Austropuccinia psidii MF-1]|uniref:Uncharacterized protein n=1 Tax=Austropuccinia psidii MF-1 TaxID=1389203 RepID=A0A9Q3BXE1_9BASI|nr:hypothetical protein [Austropuccinia psidii MF-1]
MGYVLDQLKELSEAYNPPNKVCKYKPNTQGSGLAPNVQLFRPRNTQEALHENYQPYVSAQVYSRPPLMCNHGFENRHELKIFSYLEEYMEKQTGTKSQKDLVRELEKEKKETAKNKIKNEKPLSRPEDQTIVELKKEEKEVLLDQLEDWGNWEPPTVSSPTEMLETYAVLRQRKQRFSKKESQNKEDPQSNQPLIPGTYHENQALEKMKKIVPTKYKDKYAKRNGNFEAT